MTFCAPKSLGNLPAPAGLYRVRSVCLTVSGQLYTYHYPWRSSHGPGISTILESSLRFHQWPLLSFLWGLGMAPGLNYCLGPFGLASFTPLKPVSCRDYCTLPSLTASLGCSLEPTERTTRWSWGNIFLLSPRSAQDFVSMELILQSKLQQPLQIIFLQYFKLK